MPRPASRSASPTPDSSRIFGEPTAPAARITSPAARARCALAAAPEQDAGRAPVLENRALDLDAGLEPEIGPVQHRLEEAPRRAPAPAALLVDLEVGRALVVAGVEVRRSPGCRPPPPPRGWRRGSPSGCADTRPATRRRSGESGSAAPCGPRAAGNRAGRRPSPSRQARAGASRRNRPPGRACRSWR